MFKIRSLRRKDAFAAQLMKFKHALNLYGPSGTLTTFPVSADLAIANITS
jgi:hypothetical protein